MILQFNGYDRHTQDLSKQQDGDQLLEVWTGDIDFDYVDRATYFTKVCQESCLSVEWIGGQYVYALNDHYLEDIEPTTTLPTDLELYRLLQTVVNG